MKKILIILLFLSYFLLGCTDDSSRSSKIFEGASRSSSKTKEFKELTIKQVLEEANDNFTYRGKPIHPGLVAKFEAWHADINPIIFAVDVSAAFDSNYYAEEVHEEGGFFRIEDKEGAYGYERMQTNLGGLHVIKSRWRGGGSGTFGSLFYVKFEISKSYYSNGEPYDQLILRLISVGRQ